MGILKDQTLELLKIDLRNCRLSVEIVRGRTWKLSQIERGNFQRSSVGVVMSKRGKSEIERDRVWEYSEVECRNGHSSRLGNLQRLSKEILKTSVGIIKD